MTGQDKYAALLPKYRQLQSEHKKLLKKLRKKIEFAKIILGVYAFACISWIQQNFVLAFLDKQEINASVTNTIIVSLAVTILGYYSKSIGEKHSRNINHLDEHGTPYNYEKSDGG